MTLHRHGLKKWIHFSASRCTEYALLGQALQTSLSGPPGIGSSCLALQGPEIPAAAAAGSCWSQHKVRLLPRRRPPYYLLRSPH